MLSPIKWVIFICAAGCTSFTNVIKSTTSSLSVKTRSIKKTITRTAGHEVKCPLPGNIVQVFVKEGDEVKLGDKLVMYEAMKMENTVTAEKDGVVKHLKVHPGDNVLQGEVLMEIA